MFRTTPLNFSKSSSPHTKHFIVCGDCGVGVIDFSRLEQIHKDIVFPVGSIIDFYAPNLQFESQIPKGWAICDGRSYDKNNFKELYSLLKKPNLPNLVDKIVAMRDLTEFGILSDLGFPANETGIELGVTEEFMTLDTLPFHTHDYIDTRRWGGYQFDTDSNDNGRAMLPIDVYESEEKSTLSSGVSATEPISNLQPTIKVIKIIKMI